MAQPRYRVIVEPAPRRKGWLWRQVTRNGMVGAVSPKTYDTKGSATRAAQRQVDALNWGHTVTQQVDVPPVLPVDAAVLVINAA